MAKKDAPDTKKDKAKKAKGTTGGRASVAGHPRAAASVRRAKGFGGLVGFAVVALIARKAGISHAQMLERALIGGIGGMLLAWFCAVTFWRHIVVAELKALVEQRMSEGRLRSVSASAGAERDTADAA